MRVCVKLAGAESKEKNRSGERVGEATQRRAGDDFGVPQSGGEQTGFRLKRPSAPVRASSRSGTSAAIGGR